MENPAYTQAVERPESPIVIAPVATHLDAPLLAIMFNLLGGRDRWRRLPILRFLTADPPAGSSGPSAPYLPSITWLAKYGIELKEAALANIRFDPAYEKAIEDKQIEEQRAEQKLYELVQARRQAEIVAATAKGKGDAARAQADGEADALRTKGQAEATYNANVAASLTPTLIQQQYLVRWNGQLPQYILGEGNNGVFLQLPGGLLK